MCLVVGSRQPTRFAENLFQIRGFECLGILNEFSVCLSVCKFSFGKISGDGGEYHL